MVAKGFCQCSISLFRGVGLFCYFSIERSISSQKHAGMRRAEVGGALLDGVMDIQSEPQQRAHSP